LYNVFTHVGGGKDGRIVIVGAGIGTLTGLKVFRYNHVTHKNNRANKWLLRATPTVAPNPDGHGAMLAWSFPAPR